jgi:hypothetical protein
VPPNIQRFLPIILIAFLLLIVLPAILRKSSSSSGPSSSTVSTETIGAMNLVDKGEKAYRAAHHGYTSHVADLLELERPLAHDLGDGVVVVLDTSESGLTYYAHVTSTYLGLVRARTGPKQIVTSCLVVKKGSGVACPKPPTSSTTASTTTTTSTSTTTTTAG